MTLAVQRKHVRINIQISEETRDKLAEVASLQGKKISALVRESIEEKIRRIERELFEENMKTAYKGLSEENARISEDFKYADSENLA
jgi:predicted DNA-binding protein